MLLKGSPLSCHGECLLRAISCPCRHQDCCFSDVSNENNPGATTALYSAAALAGQQAPNPSLSREVVMEGFGNLPSPRGACKCSAPVSPRQVEGKGLLPELRKNRRRKAALLILILAQLQGAGSCVCRCSKFYWLALEWGSIKQTRQED